MLDEEEDEEDEPDDDAEEDYDLDDYEDEPNPLITSAANFVSGLD